MTGLAAVLTAVLTVAAPGAARPPVVSVAVAPQHEFHVTYARMGVEGRTIQVRLRFFQDDLTEALGRFAGDPDMRLAVDPSTDSLVVAYLAGHFEVRVGTEDSEPLAGAIVASGEEIDGDQRMWWYVMQYVADRPIGHVTVDARVLLELFDDQRNILRIQHFPSEHQKTFYLSQGSTVAEFEV